MEKPRGMPEGSDIPQEKARVKKRERMSGGLSGKPASPVMVKVGRIQHKILEQQQKEGRHDDRG